MSKELIEQLAKEHEYKNIGVKPQGDTLYFFSTTTLEAFAKAYQAAAPIDNVAEALERAAKLVHESDRLNWLDATQLSKDILALIPDTHTKGR